MSTKLINGYPFVSYTKESYEPEDMQQRAADFRKWMDERRTVRDFSDRLIPKEV